MDERRAESGGVCSVTSWCVPAVCVPELQCGREVGGERRLVQRDELVRAGRLRA